MTTNALLLAFASYLSGSIPFGFLIGKAVKGVDLRQLGSGNIGATNAGRVLGKKWGLICLVLDAMKGLLPVALLPQQFFLADDPNFDHATVLAGVATTADQVRAVLAMDEILASDVSVELPDFQSLSTHTGTGVS